LVEIKIIHKMHSSTIIHKNKKKILKLLIPNFIQLFPRYICYDMRMYQVKSRKKKTGIERSCIELFGIQIQVWVTQVALKNSKKQK